MISTANAIRRGVNLAAKTAIQIEKSANQAMIYLEDTVEHIPMNTAANVAMEAARKKDLSDKKKDLG